MFFIAYVFLLAFLPLTLTLVGFPVFSRFSQVAGTALLAVASCVFYGWWDPWI